MRFSSLIAPILMTAGSLLPVLAIPIPQQDSNNGNNNSPTIDLQINGPKTNLGDPVFSQQILEYTFANSFGNPFIGTIPLPNVEFTHVMLHMETTSTGIQYDRLGRIFVNGAEIWRTSTSEPAGSPIYYSYTKDVSKYASLFRIPNVPIIMDMGNIVNDQLSGAYSVKITAKYYNAKPKAEQVNSNSVIDQYYHQQPPTSVVPIRPDNLGASSSHVYSLPHEPVNFNIKSLPRNTTRVILDIFASGSSKEEFWYMNFQDETSGAIPSKGQPNNYPSRIVKATIDDELVGAVLPFPMIYSGGFAPGLWMPVIGINGYDVPSYQIDITPYLPKLWNGANIKFFVDNGFSQNTASEWLFNANILTWETPDVVGSGEILPGTKHNDTNKFNNIMTNDVVELTSVARDVSTRAILKFKTPDDKINEEAYFVSSQTFVYNNAKSHFLSDGWYMQVAQVSSGYNSLKVSNKGVDISKYRNSADNGSSDGFSPVLQDKAGADPDLITVSESSYIYPLAVNSYSGEANSFQYDINRAYGYSDNFKTVWTKQNVSAYSTQNSGSSISTSNSRADQYYAQTLTELDGSKSRYDQYIAIDNNKIVQNTYGTGNMDPIHQYGNTDPITVLLSNAARLAKSNPDDGARVRQAIKDIFTLVVPKTLARGSASKRSDEAANVKRQENTTPTVNSLLASKIAEFQRNWVIMGKDTNAPVCWTCRTDCCKDCNCATGFMYTASVPGLTDSFVKRNGGMPLLGLGRNPLFHPSSVSEDTTTVQKRSAGAPILGLGRNPLFHPSSSSDESAEASVEKSATPEKRQVSSHHQHAPHNGFIYVSIADKQELEKQHFKNKLKSLPEQIEGNNTVNFDRNGVVLQERDQNSNSLLLKDALSYSGNGNNGLFGFQQACTTCGGHYLGGQTFSYASKNCKYGKACCADCK